MDSTEHVVNAFYRKIVVWSVVIHTLAALTIWAFVWGTIALVLRMTTNTSTPTLLWGAMGVPLGAGLGAWLARRRRPDAAAVRAYLDNFAGCGGMLMAAAERRLVRWDFEGPKSPPPFRWKGGRPLTLLAFAASFLTLCLALPINSRNLAGGSRLDVSRETERLGQQIKVLREEKILDAERAESLRQKLSQVRDQAAGKDPAKSLDALDHLNEMVRQSAHSAAESAAHEAATLKKLEVAAEALQQAAEGLSPAESGQLMKELSAMAKSAAEESEKLDEELDPELAGDAANGKLSASELPKLSAAARSAGDKVKRLAKNLHDAKLIDADELGKCEGKCKHDAKELAEHLKRHRVPLGEALSELPGKDKEDGIAFTELQFGERSTEEGTKFHEEALPPGELSLKDSQMTGLGKATPRRDKKAEAPGSGALQDAAAGGGSANSGVLLPQHRATVGRYFDRDKK